MNIAYKIKLSPVFLHSSRQIILTLHFARFNRLNIVLTLSSRTFCLSMNKIVSFLKNWTLPVAMVSGVLIYAAFHCLDFMKPLQPAAWTLERFLTPGFIFAQLLLTFCRVDPKEFRFRQWHFMLIAFQVVGCTLSYLLLAPISPILAQGAMVCFICPTATAAAVITAKLGGSAETLISYTFLINIVTAIYVPLVFPIVNSQEGLEFLHAFLLILSKVFPLLILPFIVSQILRLALPKVHAFLREHAGVSFYIWVCALALVMGKTAKSIVDDADNMQIVLLLSIVSLVTCAVQFLFGKVVAGHYGQRISGGQAIGQKNTVLAIWMSLAYLHPLSAVAPGAYVLWQNVVNSYQLWKKRHKELAAAAVAEQTK